ncbi:MAG TPA: ATP-binding protein [Gemmatimonadaceae bacterium]|nr:ATP-binding protein [Gemmatimonadaceae bacterium]
MPRDFRQLLRRAAWVGAIALAAIVATGVVQHLVQERTVRRVWHSREVLHLARSSLAVAMERAAAVRAFTLSGDTAWISAEAELAHELEMMVASLRQLTSGDPQRYANAVAIADGIRAWERGEVAPALAPTSGTALGFDPGLLAEVRATFERFIAAEDELLNVRIARDRAVHSTGLGLLMMQALLVGVVLALLGRMLRRSANELVEHQAQLQEQAVELEHQTDEAQSLAQDLELANEELTAALGEAQTARDDRLAADRGRLEALHQLDAVLASAPVGLGFLDRELRFRRVNPALAAIHGVPAGEHIGRRIDEVIPKLVPEAAAALDRVLRTGVPVLDLEIARPAREDKDRTRHFVANIYPVASADGARLGVGVVLVETTERRELEAQLRHAQKMEAVGSLAGGIAHDFNNVLTAIKSFSELVLDDLPPDSPSRRDVGEIREAADRAAALTRQLLAFSRRQLLQPLLLDPNAVLQTLTVILGRLLGGDVECVWRLHPDVDLVRADPSQLEQIVMNLAVNARDAMPGGGRLSIETANAEVDAHSSAMRELPPDNYVVLAISDTGVGMDPATRARIFEPFFTTKAAGQGTGLGLSTVYGIVRQSGGHIFVESEPGRGTTFRIYLPRAEKAAGPDRRAAHPLPSLPAGTETVLLVEDDAAVRMVASRILLRQGYRVLEARSPSEALEVVTSHPTTIELVLTDLVLPEMGGRELAERLLDVRPKMSVLYMSGYTDDAVIRRGLLEPGMPFISKPFTVEGMVRTVRETLDNAQEELRTSRA